MDAPRDAFEDPAAAWDARYAGTPFPFGTRPSAALAAIVAEAGLGATLAAGAPALCLADGDGRHGRWLAGLGAAVSALDVSPAATRAAIAADREAGLAVDRRTGDLSDWRPAGADAVLVTLQFLQGPPDLRRAALAAAGAALAPGGWLLVEGFAARAGRDPAEAPLGPSSDSRRWTGAEIDAALPGLERVGTRVGVTDLDDGPRHAGRGLVLVARRRRPG